MIPIDFEGSNITMNKPSTMTDEECMPLRAMVQEAPNGQKIFTQCWKPSYEDMKAIALGLPIYVSIYSMCPPISLFTINEHGEAN